MSTMYDIDRTLHRILRVLQSIDAKLDRPDPEPPEPKMRCPWCHGALEHDEWGSCPLEVPEDP